MSIYDIDIDKASKRLSSPDKRGIVFLKWVNALSAGLRWIAGLRMGEFRTGTTALAWAPGTYAKYARVVFTSYVYESLIDGNTASPADLSKWQIVQFNFIGLDERLKYNTEKLVLEYALNKRFKTTFRQPPAVSDIYIQSYVKPVSVFQVGGYEGNSSTSFDNYSSELIINNYSYTSYINATIWVPLAVYNALDTVPINREKIVRSFTDIYIAAGIKYDVRTY